MNQILIFLIGFLSIFVIGSNGQNQELKKHCPDFEKLEIIRYDQEFKKCGQIGEKGHCGQGMIFYGEKNNTMYGQCDCEIDQIHQRPNLYHKFTQKCYPIYSQGFCQSTWYWMTYDEDQGPVCSLNSCPVTSDQILAENLKSKVHNVPFNVTDVVPFNMACDVLGFYSEECQGDRSQILSFSGHFEPKCITKSELEKRSKSSKPQNVLECRVGSRADILKNCRNILDKPYRFVTFSEA